MSNRIVKAISVVDDRPPMQKTFVNVIEEELPKMSVIKRQLFNYHENPYADQNLAMPDKQGYIDELNRIKVEIAQAQAELRSLGGQIEAAADKAAHEADEARDGTDLDPNDVLAAAEATVERMLRDTRESIEAMQGASAAECKRLEEEAKNNGYLEGFEQGFAQAQNEFKAENNPKTQQLSDLLEQLSNYREEMVAQNEQDLMSLVMTVARKVIARELQTDSRTIVTMLYHVLDENRREENIRVEISPELMPTEAKASAEIRKMITQAAPNAKIYVDEDSDAGTIRVETDNGITDLSVSTQINNISNMLQDE